MGNLTSQFFNNNELKEAFIISYLSCKGPTPYTLDLLPGGPLKNTDDEAVVRHKFKIALKKQAHVSHVLEGFDRRVRRCLSPCMMTDFSLEGSLEGTNNMYTYTWKDGNHPERQRVARGTVPFEERNRPPTRGKNRKENDLGSLDRLVSGICPQLKNVVETPAHDKSKPVKSSLREREKKARSRPENVARSSAASKRPALSATEVPNDSLTPIIEAVSEVIVEKIELGGKRSRKIWPPKDILQKVLKDKNNPPTTFFLGRFRKLPESEPVEVDYRLNNLTGIDSFSCKGDMEHLLNEEERCKYQIDKFNNNLDEKTVFLKNVPFFFNNYETRMFWNGFLMSADEPLSARMNLKGIKMDPPTLVFDMSGLQHISASRNYSKICLNGNNNEGDVASKRSFVIRGRSENEVKAVTIDHEPNTVLVSVGLPLLNAA